MFTFTYIQTLDVNSECKHPHVYVQRLNVNHDENIHPVTPTFGCARRVGKRPTLVPGIFWPRKIQNFGAPGMNASVRPKHERIRTNTFTYVQVLDVHGNIQYRVYLVKCAMPPGWCNSENIRF